MTVRIIIGDCRQRLAGLPSKSVHTCVTSPPYFGLRNYGVDGQIGLEETPGAFVAQMVEVFREVRRVLRDGCPVGGTVLDPFGGAGTTGLVADRLQRDAILIELNPEYAAIAKRRLEGDAGMFSTVDAA